MSEQPILDWQDRAKCLDEDPELFFPVGSGPRAQVQEQDAKRVCGSCRVRTLCLDWAVSTRQYAGVWGGQSEKERSSLYAADERAFTRCLNAYAWIEGQLALSRSRRAVAKDLRVREETLRRVLDMMRAERDTLAADDVEAVA